MAVVEAGVEEVVFVVVCLRASSSSSLSSILASILLGFLLTILGVFTHLRNIWHVPSYVSEIAGPVTHVCI